MTGEAAEGFTNLYSYEVPDDIEDPLVIFFGGDNTRRYPADMEDGLPLTGRMVYDDGQWKDMPWTKPEPEDGPEVTSSVKDGTTFDEESMKVTFLSFRRIIPLRQICYVLLSTTFKKWPKYKESCSFLM